MKFRKKPVVIEAMRFKDEESKDQIINWVGAGCGASWGCDNPILVIQTLEGNMTAQLGDWIIKGVNGEYYPCKHNIFEKTYEAVTDYKPESEGE